MRAYRNASPSRSILVPSSIACISAVDLALGALTIRALLFVHAEAQMGLFGRRRRPR